MQENRRLRAQMERMRSRQAIGRGGIALGAMIIAANHQLVGMVPGAGTPVANVGSVLVAMLVVTVAAIPFLRSACPKCKRSYHRLSAVLRSVERPDPCKHCGFQINQHVSRYSQGA